MIRLLVLVACLGLVSLPSAGCDGCGGQPGRAPEREVETATEEGPEDSPPEVEPEEALPEGPVIAIDTHVDTPQRMLDDGDDPSGPLEGGHLDFPRMREGGLTGAFFSVFVNPRKFAGEARWQRALALTRAIRTFVDEHPDDAALCTTAAEVRAAAGAGKVAVLMGIEGAQAFGTDDPDLLIERLRELHRLGNRYLTITWSTDNPLGHASMDDNAEDDEKGLTELGRRVVREMHRLGMVVDVSHASDRTFWDIMEVAERPVLASHSSARALAQHPRNMTDPMIRRVAEGGGSICINFYTRYIDGAYARRRATLEWRERARFGAIEESDEGSWVDRGTRAFVLAQDLDPELEPPTVATIADHIAHVIEVGGPEAACLGSDYDGVPELPVGMADVSDLGVLREELEKRDIPVRAVFGENVLRVLRANETPAE